MRVPTANVIVSFSASAMTEVFKEGGTFKSLVEGIRKNKAVTLFDAESNPNFISFEHTLNMGGQGPTMKLTFIDPKGNFESRFMNSNIIDAYAGTESFLDDIPAAPEFTLPNTGGGFDEMQGLYWKGVTQKNIDQLPENFFGAVRTMYAQNFQEKQLYVAYGGGADLNTWASPHVVMLSNANIVEGAKKITLTLVPTNKLLSPGSRRGAYNEDVNLDLEGLLMKVEGRSHQIQFTTSEGGPHPQPLVPLPLNGPVYRGRIFEGFGLGTPIEGHDSSELFDEQKELLKILGFPKLANVIQKVDFHLIITDVIRNYIQKALTTPNVIVLLPNLNYVCRKVLSEMGELSREVKESYKKELEEHGPTDPEGREYWTPFSRSGSFTRDINSLYFQGDLGKFYDFVGKVLSYFGISLSKISLEDLSNNTTAISDPILKNPWLSTSDLQSYVGREASFFNDYYHFARIVNISHTVPNHRKLIRSIEDKIKAGSAGVYPIQCVTFYESDMELLKLWSKYSMISGWSNLFGGSRKFVENKPVVIYGDQALILQFLYGQGNLKAVTKKIAKLKEESEAAPTGPVSPIFAPAFAIVDYIGGTNRQNFIAGAENLAPFHPLDKIILLDQEYNDEVSKIINPTIGRENPFPFGDPGSSPSDMDLDVGTKEKIAESNIPVFKYNTQNPNILDLTFRFGPVYFEQLITGYRRDVWRRASTVSEGILETKYAEIPLRSVESALLFLRQTEYAFGSGGEERRAAMTALGARLHPDLVAQLGDPRMSSFGAMEASTGHAAVAEQGSVEYAVEVIFWYLDMINQVVDKPDMLFRHLLGGDAIGSIMNLGQQLYRKAMRMDIKTLPMFHLSNYGTLLTPSLVLAQNAPIVQTQGVMRSRLNTFFSGAYNIVGFRHIISSTDSFSEFSLTKAPTDYNIPWGDESTSESDSLELSVGDA